MARAGADYARRTQDDWARALHNLKRVGSQLQGPCPLCGGKDRFRVNATGGAFCNQCLPDGSDTARFTELIRTVFGEVPPPHHPQPNQRRPARASPRPKSTTGHIARKLWQAGSIADGTPTRTYLAGRTAWPPDGTGPDLPPSVRWITKQGVGSIVSLPTWAAGLMLCRFERDSQGHAVSAEAITDKGARPTTHATRFRRTYGSRSGCHFTAAEPAEPIGLRIAEGEVSALASSLMWPGWAVYASGGTGNFPEVVATTHHEVVVLECDADVPGVRAAENAIERNPTAIAHRQATRGTGLWNDRADELAELVRGAIALGASEAEAWKETLADRRALVERLREAGHKTETQI